MTPDEILLKAADDLARYGHAKQTFFESTDDRKAWWQEASACALGAIARAAGEVGVTGVVSDPMGPDTSVRHAAVRKLAESIRSRSPIMNRFGTTDDYITITSFNDAGSTTAEDVILAMKTAAEG